MCDLVLFHFLFKIMTRISVVSANVRGLRDPVKRATVFLLAGMHGDIFLLQEVHLRDEEDAAAFTREWTWGPTVWSVGSVHASGIGILFKGFAFGVSEVVSIMVGRVVYVDLCYQGLKMRVVNVYGSVLGGQRMECFRLLPGVLLTVRTVIMGGNFNTSLDRNLAVGGQGPVDYTSRALKDVVLDFGLVDVWRAFNPGGEGATWRNSRGLAARLDYVFVRRGLLGQGCTTLPTWYSDHDMVVAKVNVSSQAWGPGFWRFNTELLKARGFATAFVAMYRAGRILQPLFDSFVEWWERGCKAQCG